MSGGQARALLALGLAIVGGWGIGSAAGGRDEQRFPHARHAGLFPLCIGCHAGVLDSAAERYPSPRECARCHDGRQAEPVSWTPPSTYATNLRFSHVRHELDAKLGEPTTNCRQCHAQPGSSTFMAVQRASPQPCIACHGHPAPTHLADESPCRTCHAPLARAASLPDSTIARFPRPVSHERADFIMEHAPSVDGAQARCAICHARESCERCHVNAARLPAVAALEPDARVARLTESRPPAYPLPPSHRRAEWPYAHGADANREIARCANCHAQASCWSCHIGQLGGDAIRQLPEARGIVPRGVQLHGRDPWPAAFAGAGLLAPRAVPRGRIPSGETHLAPDTNRFATQPGPREVRVHPPFFLKTHEAAAATRQATCAGCHERRFCSDCHDGEGARRFHLPNYVQRHPADSYRRQRDCSTCHNPEVFCAGCHEGLGLRSRGRLDVAFHTAQPLWLLQHGRAARQGLESCASCHTQQDCIRCHSTTGGRVNPHGPGFDPARMKARNAITCRYCHLTDPI